MQKPKLPVSCLGSVYIESKHNELKLAIDSLIATHDVDEIIVVIDGNIKLPLQQLIDHYERRQVIRCLYLEKNQGLGLALRAGLNMCRNEIIIRFDTDDINRAERVARLYHAALQNPEVDIFGSYVYEFTPSDNDTALVRIKTVPLKNRDISNILSIRNALNHPSVAFRRSSILAIDSYRHMPLFEDYYLWLRARHYGLTFLNIAEPLVFMRRTSILQRRSGATYSKYELNFMQIICREKLISRLYIVLFVARLLVRNLPIQLQLLQYYLPWRTRPFLTRNPEKLSMASDRLP